ncbi:MAG: type II secretion system F family protein [bacterium]|nr:type II secretion system F family protein [bacterium]
MGLFTYKARQADGSIISGVIEADDVRKAITNIRSKGLTVISTEEKKADILAGFLKAINIFDKVSLGDRVLFSRQFSTLINAGIPVIQCLNILVDQTKKNVFKGILRDIRTNIESGEFISSAIAKHSDAFDNLYVSMVKAGEVGGVLDEVLDRLALYLENIAELKRKVIGAMVYPIMIVFVAVGVVGFLLTFVIPKFKDVFKIFGEKLPAPTQILISVSDFLVKRGWIVALVVIGIFMFAGFMIKTVPAVKYRWHKIILRVPLIGELLLKVAVARFTRTLGTLARSGVPILEALEICATTSGNKVIEAAIMDGRSAIKEGERISESLKTANVFPPMVVQMISIGEETGALDSMLFKVADYYDKEVDATVAALASIIEPALIVFLGVVVGFIVVAMYLPIFSLPAMIK